MAVALAGPLRTRPLHWLQDRSTPPCPRAMDETSYRLLRVRQPW